MLNVARSGCRVGAGLSAVLALAMAAATARAADPLDPLRHGGVTLLMRHAPSDWSQEAVEFAARAAGRFEPKDCRTQRNLSPEGRSDARLIGAAIRSLKLRIAEVDASPLCRAQDTARIAFGQATVVDDLAPRTGGALAGADTALKRLVAAPVPERALRIIVDDYETAQSLFGHTLGEGDSLVLKRSGSGSIEVVGTITLEDWRAIAPVASSSVVPALAR
jgi:hypothetical protein